MFINTTCCVHAGRSVILVFLIPCHKLLAKALKVIWIFSQTFQSKAIPHLHCLSFPFDMTGEPFENEPGFSMKFS